MPRRMPARSDNVAPDRDPLRGPARRGGALACGPAVSLSAPIRRRCRRTPRGQQLERDRGEREDVSRRSPFPRLDPLGCAVRPAHRRADAGALERFDDAESGRARFVGRYKDVTRMQAAVTNASRAGEIDRAGQLGDERQRLLDRGRRIVAHRDVQRLGRHVLLGAVRQRALDAGSNRLDDGRMEETGFRRATQLVRERLRLLGDDIEAEDFDGDEAIARGFVGAKDGTERANADLVQHAERAERGRRGECAGVLSGQRRSSWEQIM